MADIERLKELYEEKQSKYKALTASLDAIAEAYNKVKAECDEAMRDMHEAGEELIRAMESQE